ncbi:MAG TPA: 16S rRNA (cytosine(1402)-N(4))-methyltransferase RsmH [Pyrinomonadaceae bacterium]|jgi:16S rRNA (cytosine1402-N4)-methyltransferase|nr:16S rRNA (cytosine(1402)-N(4))-methyltransferase RsmH [Pyrinomonadaceae bacterium]
MTADLHVSVMLDETLRMLEPGRGGLFVDCTLGLGGHSEAILAASDATRIIGIDQDDDALRLAGDRLARFGGRAMLVKANFSELRDVVDEPADGILADLGVSSLQLDSETRGFSFRFDAPLDMRMDTTSGGQTAAELLAETSEKDLADIIYRFGEERHSRRIAKWIVEKREAGTPITMTTELAELVRRAVRTGPKDKIHPATRTFQALRIAVNGELDILEKFLFDAADILKTEGVLAVITFHSLEDRIVKHAFQRLAGRCICPPRQPVCICGATQKVEILTRKPILPTEDEARQNPRSRSAKLRACRKL